MKWVLLHTQQINFTKQTITNWCQSPRATRTFQTCMAESQSDNVVWKQVTVSNQLKAIQSRSAISFVFQNYLLQRMDNGS